MDNTNNQETKVAESNSITQPIDLKEYLKKNQLSGKTKTFLLCCMICVLLAYIIGTEYIDKLKTESETSITEISTVNTTSTESMEENVSKININTDSIEELCALTGIGESKAKKIISYRKEHGDFQNIEELKNVSGIGEKTFDNIKDQIYIENEMQ